jgi:hypothetical protein
MGALKPPSFATLSINVCERAGAKGARATTSSETDW